VSGARMRALADIRSRPVSLVLVTFLVAIIGAVAIAALDAARRTDSAYERYRAAANEPEAVVLSCDNGFPPKLDLTQVRSLPEVEASAIAAYGLATVADAAGHPLFYRQENLGVSIVGLRNPQDARVLRPRLLEGRYPTEPDEVAAGWGDTDAPRPAVGDTIDIRMVPQGVIDRGEDPFSAKPIHYRVRVTGQVLMPGDLTGDQATIWTSSAFIAAHQGEAWMCDGGAFQLKGDSGGGPSFLARVYAIEPGAVAFDTSGEAIYVSRTTHLDAIVLRLLAGLAALGGIIVLGQSLVRRTSLGAIDTPILRALGMKRREIVWAAALPALVVAAGGALLAVTGAIAASALFPTGLPRIIEPDPGIHVDILANGLGVALIVITTMLSVLIPAWWLASARGGVGGAVEYQRGDRRSAIASAVARLPLSVSARAGTRLALEPGHGRSATPVRSTVVGLTLAVATMVAAFGFAASMDHFAATPRLWGVNFDFGAGQPFVGADFQDKAVPVIRGDPQVQNLVAGNFQQYISLQGGGSVGAQEAVWALEKIKGRPVTTTMLEGRWPETSSEIGLGRETLSLLGVRVGDTVTATVAGTARRLKVVGVPVFPDIGFGPGLGRGAAMTMDGLRVFYPSVTENLVLGDFTEGADAKAVLGRLNKEVLNDLDAGTQAGIALGTTVQGTVRSRALPLQLSVLFALAAFGTLVHVLLTSVRRRRRDLAILQTLGFRRRQVAATIAWQALTLAALALTLGVPIGILAGRLGWAAFAYRLGVVSEPVTSPLAIVVIPAMLAVALIVSLGPGLVARRVRPATVLKAE
jgi:hypothetical protein